MWFDYLSGGIVSAVCVYPLVGPPTRQLLTHAMRLYRGPGIPLGEPDYELMNPESLPESDQEVSAALAADFVKIGFQAVAYLCGRGSLETRLYLVLWVNRSTGDMATASTAPNESFLAFDTRWPDGQAVATANAYFPSYWRAKGETILFCPEFSGVAPLYQVHRTAILHNARIKGAPVLPEAGAEVEYFRQERISWITRGVLRGDIWLDPATRAARFTWEGAVRVAWASRLARMRAILRRDRRKLQSMLPSQVPPKGQAFAVLMPERPQSTVRPVMQMEEDGSDGDG